MKKNYTIIITTVINFAIMKCGVAEDAKIVATKTKPAKSISI